MSSVFWKLSQGKDFDFDEVIDTISEGLVYVHRNTKAKGTNKQSQAQQFVEASIGDYFYLTYGNNFVCLLGQFSGPANFISRLGDGWIDRPFRRIRSSQVNEPYDGAVKRWTPNENSTFVRVPDSEHDMFERLILSPYFDVTLAEFQVV